MVLDSTLVRVATFARRRRGRCGKGIRVTDNDQEDTTIYRVVMNHEEQYSIWPAQRDNPLGWHDAGPSGPMSVCLAYINQVWTDMRPLSLRRAMSATNDQTD